MILIKQIFLAVIGLSCGAAVAGGVFGFITMLGIVPRLAGRTGTAKHILLYESAIILGGALGNIWHIFSIKPLLSLVMVCLYGLFSGIFVGCLAMALAEVLRVLPIMIHRLRLKEGFPIVVLGIALGKTAGALYQFFW